MTRSLVERAAAAGYRAILLTVDLPLLGYRERDRRSGFDLDIPLGNFVSQRPEPSATTPPTASTCSPTSSNGA